MSKFAPHHRSSNQPRATSSTICQKCLRPGHFIYECKSTRPYISRPTRTQQLENPRLLTELKSEGKPSVDVPEEFLKKSGTANKILETNERERLKLITDTEEGSSKKRARASSSSSSDSSSNSDSGSESDSDSASGSDSDSSQSRERARKRRRRARRYSSSSSSSSDASRGRRT